MVKQTRAAGYTPLFDEVVTLLDGDVLGALVFGVIWRHSQMRNGYCHACVSTLAGLTGLNERTVQRRLRKLLGAGLIVEVAEARQHTPTGYAVAYTPNGKGRVSESRGDRVTPLKAQG